MTSGISQGLADYGDPEFSMFLRRTFVKAMGYGDDALDRIVVGITNTYSDYNPCHGNVPRLIEAVKRGVMLSGGLPLEFPTISLNEAFVSPTSMFLRNLMALDTEEMIRAQPMDAVVLVGGCDKTLPAQLMAAASADRPAIVLPVGPMLVGHHRGTLLGACTDCRRLWAEFRAGEIGADELSQVSERLAPTVGTCMVMGTASTMACVSEALGMALPGSGTVPATHADRLRVGEAVGRRAVELARGGPTPSEILTRAAFRNALVVLQAIGGSTNALVHLAALAGRLNITIDLAEVDRIGREVPVLVDVKPTGEHYLEHFHWAGGVPKLLFELSELLDLTAPTVASTALSKAIDRRHEVPGQLVIRSREAPLRPAGAIAVVWGNLAPRGAVIKQSAASADLLRHEAPAVVFESVEDMTRRIDDEALEVDETSILVLRNEGPVGAPGMPEAGLIPIPRKLAANGVKDLVRVSDARMSGTAYGTIVLHVAPEAAIGGPLALVQDGDRIRLDLPKRELALLVDDDELAGRAREWVPPTGSTPRRRGYEELFVRSVLQADAGCDFDFCLPQDGASRAQPAGNRTSQDATGHSRAIR
jgi:dihydroxy-acid dehydratase